MKTLVRLEELGMVLLSIVLFSTTGYAWWWFLLLILTPDISMAGYLVNAKTGAFLYNVIHHKGVAILIYLLGFYYISPLTQMIGIILFAHSSMDRIFGYGLKYSDSFHHTHLGWIGKRPNGEN
ncbi:DUF4260 domain-containing protein [Aliifodinibius sp. S!AR15-10]|uniref:DUF4260 domain-containing protein n=1 Tax=Aliifodinibius sp. S!AR15-10 TaxID=2950437 RepID=UPI00285DBD13|nr:DUF4260 domain-containing protein [Aliifodinibius sp. S!AR15-10]MDR8391835.1 DUF4260 domain-containing protein [Aliifodinibius sp. S!AR15-10]